MPKTPLPTQPDKFSFSASERFSSSKIHIDGKSYLDFTSFDYFNFFQDVRVRESLFQSAHLSSVMSSAPRSLGGTSIEHVELEVALARFFRQSTSVFLSSRNQAVLTLITGLISENDIVIFDEDSSSPIADACYLVGAATFPIDLLSDSWPQTVARAAALAKAGSKIYLFAEEVSSITGANISLKDTLSQLKYFGATLILDTSYSLGINQEYPPGENIIFVGGFGYSIPGYGGFVVGDNRVESIRKRSKVLSSEVPLPPFMATFSKLALQLIPEVPLKLPPLSEKVSEIALDLKKLPGGSLFGRNLPSSYLSPILSIQFLTENLALSAVRKLVDSHILVTRTSRGKLKSSRDILRFNCSVSITDKDLLHLKKTLSEV